MKDKGVESGMSRRSRQEQQDNWIVDTHSCGMAGQEGLVQSNTSWRSFPLGSDVDRQRVRHHGTVPRLGRRDFRRGRHFKDLVRHESLFDGRMGRRRPRTGGTREWVGELRVTGRSVKVDGSRLTEVDRKSSRTVEAGERV